MSRLVKITVIAVAVLGAGTAAFEIWMHRALETPDPPSMMPVFVAAPHAVGEPDLRRRVFLDVNASPPAQVFSGLAPTIGCTLDLASGIDQPVTLRVWNVTAETALNAICESIGCRWQLAGSVLKVEAGKRPPDVPLWAIETQKLRTPLPVGMRFDAVPFGEAVAALSRVAGIDFVVERIDPGTPVTLNVSDEQPLQALFRLAYAAGWTGGGEMTTSEKNGRVVLRFTPRRALAKGR